MAVLINLLPDLHQQKINAKHNRALAIALAVIISGVAVGLVVILFVVTQAQAFALGRLQDSINEKQAAVQQTPNLQAILTVQRNLKSLPVLYNKRRYINHFFEILQAVSPTSFTITSLAVNDQNIMNVTGKAGSAALMNKLIKAMESDSVVRGGPKFSNPSVNTVSFEGGEANFTLTATLTNGATNAQ